MKKDLKIIFLKTKIGRYENQFWKPVHSILHQRAFAAAGVLRCLFGLGLLTTCFRCSILLLLEISLNVWKKFRFFCVSAASGSFFFIVSGFGRFIEYFQCSIRPFFIVFKFSKVKKLPSFFLQISSVCQPWPALPVVQLLWAVACISLDRTTNHTKKITNRKI